MSKYIQTIITLPSDVAATVEEERRIRRRARIVWMGYADVADQLTEILKSATDGSTTSVCAWSAHSGSRWHCRKKLGFLTDLLQR